jgi:deazaflavin-dependent oxidoreductase (nitroreductase family)
VSIEATRSRVAGFTRRLGGTQAGVRTIGRVVSRVQRSLYRWSGGCLTFPGSGAVGSGAVLLLTTTGRRTGRKRTVPLLYVRDGDNLVACNVNPGFEHENPWVLNVRADPHALVQVGRAVLPVVARAATGQEGGRAWPELVRIWPAYRTFAERGGKRTLFVLEPVPFSSTRRTTTGETFLELSIDIRRSPGEVYTFLADVQDVEPIPRRATVKMVKGPPTETSVGTRWHEPVRPAPGLWLHIESAVTEVEPPHLLGMDFTTRWFSGHLTYTLEPIGDGTRLYQHERLRPRLMRQVLNPLLGRQLQVHVEERLMDLKHVLECQAQSKN